MTTDFIDEAAQFRNDEVTKKAISLDSPFYQALTEIRADDACMYLHAAVLAGLNHSILGTTRCGKTALIHALAQARRI